MRSFVHAARGILTLLRTQRNAQWHFAAALWVLVAAFLRDVSRVEFCVLALAIGLVITAEALNTGIEFVCDALHPEHHPLIGHAKDVAAGGVLLSAAAAAVVGLVIFLG